MGLTKTSAENNQPSLGSKSATSALTWNGNKAKTIVGFNILALDWPDFVVNSGLPQKALCQTGVYFPWTKSQQSKSLEWEHVWAATALTFPSDPRGGG